MFAKCYKSLQLNIKHSDESLQAQINKYDFATNYKKDTYCVKWHEKKSSFTAESEWKECIWQYDAQQTLTWHEEEKSF